MRHGFGLNKILGTIHIYPTLAEANKYAAGVWKKWLARSLYSAQKRPFRSITSRSAAITVRVDSSSTNCA